jgi:DNA-binding MarR family transcriptional regulator
MVRIEQAYGFQIVRMARLLRLHFTRFAEKAGFDLTQEQWLMMNKLAQNPDASQLSLADSLIHDKPNITRIVAGLEKKKLVRRQHDKDDRRIMRVRLTAAGEKTHREFSQHVLAERDRLHLGLTQKDFENLLLICGQLEKNMSGTFDT